MVNKMTIKERKEEIERLKLSIEIAEGNIEVFNNKILGLKQKIKKLENDN
jgi:hypothetical protein